MRGIFLACLLAASMQCRCAQQSVLPPFINTHYPLTHFCLNFLGLFNLIKGAALDITPLNWFMTFEPTVNEKRLLAGASLILFSRILHHYELFYQKSHSQPQDPSPKMHIRVMPLAVRPALLPD